MPDSPEFIEQVLRLQITRTPAIHRCERGWHWFPAPLPDHDLWYVLDGFGKMELQGVTNVLRPGSCALFQPGDQPRITQDPSRRLVVFAVHFKFQATGSLPGLAGKFITARDTSAFVFLAHRCVAGYRRNTLAALQSRLSLQQMLLLLCEEQASPTEAIDTQIQQILLSIGADPGKRCSIASLAKSAHLSRSQFTRRFIASAGMSPGRHLIHARLSRARQMMTESDMTLSQIADALRYPDVYFFSRQFKRHMGFPPSMVRKKRNSQAGYQIP